jgi:D-tyrosyl-tRNA(Tyr) deacylase
MRALIQRVSGASVSAEGRTTGEISNGLLVLLGIATDDTRDDALWLLRKIIGLRIFPDAEDKMNHLSVLLDPRWPFLCMNFSWQKQKL